MTDTTPAGATRGDREASVAPSAWDADADQRAVVTLPHTTSGVVVGAPGTGKTATVVARVAALVADGLDPDTVLVLTPSRQTATALRDRLALAVGTATSGPLARSLAALAFQLVRGAEVHRGGQPPQLLTGGDEDQILHDLLAGDADDELAGRDSRWPQWLTPAARGTRGFRADVRAFFAECETLGIEHGRLRALGERFELPIWVSLSSFLAEYQQVRADMRGSFRDAAGLVREAIGVLRTAPAGPSPVLGAFARTRVLLVDDAQELTLGGVELLEACAARGIAVLAFGDPDVGSGVFRGATPENFARLTASLGEIHVLRTVHRGAAAQQDLVREITQRIGAGGVVAHRSPPTGPPRADGDGAVRAFALRSASEEYDVIARMLRERHVRDGVPWSQCAVIAHDTRQVAALENELSAREVPARASGPGRALAAQRPVRDLLALVELGTREATSWTPEELIDALSGTCGGLDPVELRRLRTTLRHAELAAGGERPARELLTSAMRQPLEFDLVDTREARAAARTARTLAALAEEHARGASAHELLWTAWEKSRLQKPWLEASRTHGPLSEQAGRDLDAVVALFESAKRFGERGPDADPRVFVHGLLGSEVAEDRLSSPPPEQTVRVLTPAGALGAEFDTVIVAGMQEGVWPNTRLRGGLLETWRLADAVALPARPHTSGDVGVVGEGPGIVDRRRSAMHDELRLFARSASRARSRLVVTAVDDDDNGPSPFFELLPPAEPASRAMEHPLSLRGMVARHRRALTESGVPEPSRRHAAGQLALLADAGVVGAPPSQWYGVSKPTSSTPLRDLAREDVRVSPSRLQALEECELNWVIGDLGGDPGSTTAGIGTIIHAALEHAADSDEAALWAAVEERWGELSFEAPWRERAEKTRARDLVRRLHVYLRRFEQSGATLVGAEPHFEVAIPFKGEEGFDHGVILSGYIDRVELTPEGTVLIIDLKTGKNEPQTDDKVRDNPQLAAYQLAFESGAIPAVAGLPGGGAALLVLRPTAKTVDYVTPRQLPFDEAARTAFLARVQSAVTVMRGSSFAAPYEEHCRDDHSYGLCRIHTIAPVSAS